MDRVEQGDEPTVVSVVESVPSRNPLSRLSFGHVIMIAAGLLAIVLNISLLRSGDETSEVVVLGRDVSAGSRLVVADLEFAEVASDSPFLSRTLDRTTVEPLLGQIVTRDLDRGAPLLSDDLREAAAPDAGRAMSIPISPTQAVAADVQRGDRIDVIVVRDGVAEYVATGLEVLAVAEQSEGRLAATSDFSVTVGIDDAGALAIASALDTGTVHIVRSTGAPEVVVGAVESEDG